MSLAPVLKKLNEISDISSTNGKVSLLHDYLEDRDFLTVTKLALAGDMKYNIKKLPDFKPSLRKGTVPEIFSLLRKLSRQKGTSDSEKLTLARTASIDKATYEILNRICNKDLKCGVSAKLVNKARPGTVNIVPYMRCSTEKKIDNIQFPAIIQEKADGMFVNIMINSKGHIKIITRNGKTVWGLRHLKKVIRQTAARRRDYRRMVFNGELLVRKNGKILDRKTGNGILNSCIHGTASKKDAKCVVFRAWDCLPLKNFYNGYDSESYVYRLHNVKQFVKTVGNKKLVDLVVTKQVASLREAKEFYKWIRSLGGEGAVLKNTYGEWKDHTSPNQVKMKNVSEAELKVVAWNNGKQGSKYEGMLGALVCETECGLLKVSVGSGFSDEEREKDQEYWLGGIISAEFESVIKDKKKKTWSLFLPRYVERRFERDKADTLEEIRKR
jgi:DNA ligase-1